MCSLGCALARRAKAGPSENSLSCQSRGYKVKLFSGLARARSFDHKYSCAVARPAFHLFLSRPFTSERCPRSFSSIITMRSTLRRGSAPDELLSTLMSRQQRSQKLSLPAESIPHIVTDIAARSSTCQCCFHGNSIVILY